MLNMLLIRVLFILCVTLVCMLTVSDIGPFGFLLALAAWGVMELAAVFHSGDRTRRGPESWLAGRLGIPPLSGIAVSQRLLETSATSGLPTIHSEARLRDLF
jgi:hypothetical protein